ncbi:MAG: NAD(P)/FAD-dependent oxidoreductase [Pseudomonadota bacterium]
MIFDALIIGAGPAGSTTALLLATAGWSVGLVEKQVFPRRKVCGEFISATSLPLLQKLGIADFYLQDSGPEVRRVGLFAANTVIASAMPPANHSLSNWGRAFGREHLDSALLARAVSAGVTLWQPWVINSLERKAGLFTATVAANEQTTTITARVVIMAQGSWERGIGCSAKVYPHQPADLLAFKAHFKNATLAPDLMPLLAFPGGYGGMVHSSDKRVTLSCCIRRDTLETIRKQHLGLPAAEAVLRHIKASCLGVREVLADAERVDKWLAAGPIRPGIRKCYEDGVFFVGNIAGEAHPIVAEGISMAMQSGWLLAEVLIAGKKELFSGKNIDLAGQKYTKQWRVHFANRIHAAAFFSKIAIRPWAVMFLLPLVKQFPGILTFGAKLSGKIKQVVFHHSSPLPLWERSTRSGG